MLQENICQQYEIDPSIVQSSKQINYNKYSIPNIKSEDEIIFNQIDNKNLQEISKQNLDDKLRERLNKQIINNNNNFESIDNTKILNINKINNRTKNNIILEKNIQNTTNILNTNDYNIFNKNENLIKNKIQDIKLNISYEKNKTTFIQQYEYLKKKNNLTLFHQLKSLCMTAPDIRKLKEKYTSCKCDNTVIKPIINQINNINIDNFKLKNKKTNLINNYIISTTSQSDLQQIYKIKNKFTNIFPFDNKQTNNIIKLKYIKLNRDRTDLIPLLSNIIYKCPKTSMSNSNIHILLRKKIDSMKLNLNSYSNIKTLLIQRYEFLNKSPQYYQFNNCNKSDISSTMNKSIKFLLKIKPYIDFKSLTYDIILGQDDRKYIYRPEYNEIFSKNINKLSLSMVMNGKLYTRNINYYKYEQSKNDVNFLLNKYNILKMKSLTSISQEYFDKNNNNNNIIIQNSTRLKPNVNIDNRYPIISTKSNILNEKIIQHTFNPYHLVDELPKMNDIFNS